MLGTKLKHRYILEQILGRSALGTLYLATDETSGEMLAVKVFRRDIDLRGEDGLRYLRLLRRLASVNHPHLIVPQEAGLSEGVAFQVSPYFPAPSLEEVLADGPLSLSEGVVLLGQVAAGLSALHGAGVAHLNLKPTNILVSREDGPLQAVVTDPGQALVAGDDFPHGGLDSAAYRAPEELPWWDVTPDARADLYALGMIAYRLFTGQLPFSGHTPQEVLRQHVVRPAPAPQGDGEPLPPGLAALLLKLTAKHPRERYQSAETLRAELAAFAPGGAGPARPAIPEAPFRLPAAALRPGTGQAHEAALTALARASRGKGTLLLLTGEPGAGGREWFESLMPHVEAAQGLALRATAPAEGWGAPLGLPLALMEEVLRRWELFPDTTRRDLLFRLHAELGDNAALITGLLPELRTLLPEAGAPVALPAHREPARVLHALGSALLALADPRHPLVLWLGRMEAADRDSLAWLLRLAHRIPEHAVVVVAAADANRLVPGHVLHPWLAPTAPPGLQRVDLPPLTVEDSAVLTATRLGLPSAGEAAEPAPAVGAWLHRRWGGEPLAQQMGLTLLLARRLLRRDGETGTWIWDGEEANSLHWPETRSGLIRAWLEELPEAVRLVVEAAAIFPGPFTFESLAGVLDHLPVHLLLDHVEQAIARDILRRTGGRLRFPSARVRGVVYRDTPAARREAYHGLVGAMLEAHPTAPPLQHHHEVALHFQLGGDRERHAAHALEAAREAGAHRALHGTVAWYRTATALLGQDPALPEHWAALAAALALLRRWEEARETLAKAQAAAANEALRVELLHLEAWISAESGDHPAAVAALEQALELAGASLPSNPVGSVLARLGASAARRYEGLRAIAGGGTAALPTAAEQQVAGLLELAARVWRASQPHRALLADEKLLRLHAGRVPVAAVARALTRLGEAGGDPDAPAFQQAGTLVRHHPFPHERALWHLARGRSLLHRFRLGEAREAFQQAREGFHALGDLIGQCAVLREQGEVERVQGPVDALVQRAGDLIVLGGLAEAEDAAQWGRGLRAHGLALAGRQPVAETASALSEAAREAHTHRIPGGPQYFLALRGSLHLAQGDVAAAQELFRGEDGFLPDPLGPGDHLLQVVAAETRLMQAAAFPDEREFQLQQARRLLRGLTVAQRTFPRLNGDLARLEVMHRALRGDGSGLLRATEAGEALLVAQGGRQLLGQLYFRAAEGLKHLGDDSWLHWGGKALTTFDALGAHPYLNATRALLDIDPLIAGSESAPGAQTPVAAGAAPGGNGTLHPTLLGLLEQLAAGEPLETAALHEALLRVFMEAADAECGALCLAGDDGRLLPVRHLPETAQAETAVNRWLVDKVWQSRRGRLLENYQPIDPPTGSAAYVPAPQSLLCSPLVGAGVAHGVVFLSSSMGRLIFERSHLARVTGLARQAAAVLALHDRGAHLRDRQAHLDADMRSNRFLLEWGIRVAERADCAGMLTAYLEEAGEPLGFTGAALWWAEGGSGKLRRGAWVARGRHGSDPEHLPDVLDPGALPQVSEAITRQRPVPLSESDPTAGPAERAVVTAMGGADGLWLPLTADGEAVAILLLTRDQGGAWQPEGDSTPLTTPLRVIAPALLRAWQGERTAAEREALTARVRELETVQTQAQAFLPVHLRGPGAAAGAGAEAGEEVWAPVLAGRLFGLAPLARLGKEETLRYLRAYYRRLEEVLALHHGRLERLTDQQWVARFERGPESAFWCALSLQQTQAAFQDEHARGALPLVGTSLGIHLGTVITGTIAAGERLEAVATGDGLRSAARMAHLGRSLRTPILASADAVEGLHDPEAFALRSLGSYRLEPGERRLLVYELCAEQNNGSGGRVRAAGATWNEAIRLYGQGKWSEAAERFQAYLTTLPHDRPARQLLKACRQRGHR